MAEDSPSATSPQAESPLIFNHMLSFPLRTDSLVVLTFHFFSPSLPILPPAFFSRLPLVV